MPKETMDRLVSSTSRHREVSKKEVESDIMSIEDDVDTLGEELARHAISEGQLWFFMDPHRTGKVRSVHSPHLTRNRHSLARTRITTLRFCRKISVEAY